MLDVCEKKRGKGTEDSGVLPPDADEGEVWEWFRCRFASLRCGLGGIIRCFLVAETVEILFGVVYQCGRHNGWVDSR